jgi:hypothetical protein
VTVLKFPSSGAGEREPPGPRGPRPIYVCAPNREDMLDATRKVGLGYSKAEAQTRFYEGGLNQEIETRTFTLKTAPKWLLFWLTNQFLMHDLNWQPLSPVDEDACARLGPDPYKYGTSLRGPEKKR